MIELIQKRLEVYQVNNAVEEEQAIKEIIQEIALYALWRAGFFEVAAFQGGTSLRILHKMPRFSEDLDFILKTPDKKFEWKGYLKKLLDTFEEFGLHTEVLDKSKMERNLKIALLKDNSVASQLNLNFYRSRKNQIQKIKLEIDINPPEGSDFEYSYLDFPADFEVCHQNLSSNFSLKIHALLCRPYVKGRDWYDFNWYVKGDIKPNIKLLEAALIQAGPWKGREIMVDEQWIKGQLQEKIASINWDVAVTDVERFLKPLERESLRLWNERFFTRKVNKLF